MLVAGEIGPFEILAAIIMLLPFGGRGIRSACSQPFEEIGAAGGPGVELGLELGILLDRTKFGLNALKFAATGGEDVAEGFTFLEADYGVRSGKLPVHSEGEGSPVGLDYSG